MRVLIATMGTMGDLEPYLALVRRLLDEGHDVRLTSQDGHAERCAEAGVPFTSIGITDQLYGRMRELTPLILAERRPLKQLRLITEGLAEIQLPALPALRAMVREVDLVVHAPPSICAVAAARAEGIPDVSATHSWPAQPATEYGPANVDRGPLLNKLTWRRAQQLYAKVTDPPYNKIVTAAGLSRWRNITYGARRSALLDLVALSPAVLPLTRRAAPVTEITGYWFLDEDDFIPPPDLAEFLTGPPPLVIGLGSTASTHGYEKHALARIVAEAVTGLEHRVIVQGDFLREAGIEPGPNVFVSGRVPYLWLFRRAIGVVHQGGGGTAAAAFRAGIPQAIVSHVGDQPEWGRRVAQLGVGPAHCPYTRLDTVWLASALRTLAQDASMAERARLLGAAVRAQDGTGRAVRALERVCSNVGGAVTRRREGPEYVVKALAPSGGSGARLPRCGHDVTSWPLAYNQRRRNGAYLRQSLGRVHAYVEPVLGPDRIRATSLSQQCRPCHSRVSRLAGATSQTAGYLARILCESRR